MIKHWLVHTIQIGGGLQQSCPTYENLILQTCATGIHFHTHINKFTSMTLAEILNKIAGFRLNETESRFLLGQNALAWIKLRECNTL